MKRIALPVVLAIALAASVSAQSWGPQGMPGGGSYGRGPGYMQTQAPAQPVIAAPELVTIEGKLELVNAQPAIKVAGITYLVHIPGRLYGFIDGIKEGAQVKLEGYKVALPAVKDTWILHTEKLTLNGRVIDLSTSYGPGMHQGQGQRQGPGAGRMGNMGGRGSMGGMGGRMSGPFNR